MEMTTPLVSVVIPVYNSMPYLTECLDSIIRQTYKNTEIICIDDGSNDGSSDVLDRYGEIDSRLFIFHRKKASGSGALPRNIGLNQAIGKYVLFLDSDDYFDHTMITKLVDKAEKVSSDLVMCDSFNVYEDGTQDIDHTELHVDKIPHKDCFSYRDIPKNIFQITNAAAWHRLFLREMLVYNGIQFQEKVPILDDIYFTNISLVKSRRISIVSERLIYYRRNRDGGQTSKTDRNMSSVYKSFRAVYDEFMNFSDFELIKCSLQTWTISTMKWWLASLNEETSYHKLLDFYKDEYLPGLMLTPEGLSDDVEPYWKNIIKQILDGTFPYICSSFLRFYVTKKTSIVLYGAGDEGKKIVKLIDIHEHAKLCLWLDKEVRRVGEKKVYPPESIGNVEHDMVLIAINNPAISSEVKRTLVNLGEPEDRIYTVIE